MYPPPRSFFIGLALVKHLGPDSPEYSKSSLDKCKSIACKYCLCTFVHGCNSAEKVNSIATQTIEPNTKIPKNTKKYQKMSTNC
jgi:hypothetical protein